MALIGHNGRPAFGSDAGWVAIARAMRDHPLVGFHLHAKPADPSKGAMQPALAFIDLLMECRYEDGYLMNGGRKMLVQRGQMIGAVSWLAARWNWTPMAVRIWLDKLEADKMISRFAPGASDGNKQYGKQATIITFCNYDEYQARPDENEQAEQQANNKQATSKQQASNNIYKDNKGTKEQRNKDTPQTPASGESSPPDGGGASAGVKISDVVREAFVEWQAFARVHGLPVPKDTSFQVYADDIRRRMLQHVANGGQPVTRASMMAVWHLALAYVAKSGFLRGFDGSFRADLGMVLRPKNFAKLISGGYGNGASPIGDRWALSSQDAQPSQIKAHNARTRGSVMTDAINELIAEAEHGQGN